MPHVTVTAGPLENPVYQVGGKSFVFFRNARPDAFDPETGERYADVIVIWVESAADKEALVQDPDSPFFTTPHFDGHLVGARAGEPARRAHPDELAETIQDAWLCRPRRPECASGWRAKRAADERDTPHQPHQ